MKITGLELFHIRIPFARPYKLSKKYGTLTHAQAVLFKVHTDEGLVGFGEADPMHPFTEETPATVLCATRDLIAPHLIGRDPTRIAEIEAELDRAVNGHWTARGAVNMALQDLSGKANGVPVHLLLGGRCHSELPLLGPIGSGTPEEDAEAIEEWVAKGYRTAMIKMGALPIAKEVKRMISASERFGDRVALMADANQGWQMAEALRFLDGVGDHCPTLLEQPIPRGDLRELKRLRERARCPLSADESLVTAQDAADLIRAHAVDVFSIKVSKNGGLSKAKKIAQAADVFGLRVLMNSMLEFGVTQAASLQLGCTLSNLLDMGHAYMSVLRMADDVTDFCRNISGGVVTVPENVGLGVEVDESKLRRYSQESLRVGSVI